MYLCKYTLQYGMYILLGFGPAYTNFTVSPKYKLYDLF